MEILLPDHRERLFPPTETLSMFLAQAMSQDRSCQSVVDDAAIKRLMGGLPVGSTHTGAYCRARKRLPLEMIPTLTRHTGRMITERAPSTWHWRGRPVRLVDSATVTLPDTPDNQEVYPQPSSQQSGRGFPLCRLVGIICLTSGAVLNSSMGPCQGKGSDEQSQLRSMQDTLESGDILLGDTFYATYFLVSALQKRGVDGVFEQQGSRRRSTDFRRGQRLGPRDHMIELYKPKIKTTLRMEMLSCRTPAMAEKEIWVYLLTYNLIRLLMPQAAFLADMLPRQLSFKHTLQTWIAWRQNGAGSYDDDKLAELFILMAQQQVGNRPGRIEPRAVKRRPKPFPLLTKPRRIAHEDVRKNGHPKKLKLVPFETDPFDFHVKVHKSTGI